MPNPPDHDESLDLGEAFRSLASYAWASADFRPKVMARVSQPPGTSRDAPPTVWALPRHPVPFVGRRAELATLMQCVRRLQAGQGGLIGVIGAAGLGKSRLITTIRQQTGTAPLHWFEGATRSQAPTASYGLFQDILRQYAGITVDDPAATAWRKLAQRVTALDAQQAPELLPYLAHLLQLDVPGAMQERLIYLDGDAMGRQIYRAVRRFVARLAQEQPLVVVVDDIHWADEASVRLLEHLLPLVTQVPLLLWGLGRPDEPHAAHLRELVCKDYAASYTELHLRPLSAQESGELLHHLMQGEPLAPAVHTILLHKAEGNPFYLEELLRTALATGVLVHDPASQQWQPTAQMASITLPATIQKVILTRVGRLGDEAQEVVQTAAVIGRQFSYRLLQQVSTSGPRLDGHLTALERAALIRRRRREPEVEYVFTHALIQDAVYHQLTLAQRQVRHRQVGEALERLSADRLEAYASVLAYHYTQAQAWPQAQAYMLLAGDQAGRVAADVEALAYYQQAVAAYDRAGDDQWTPVDKARLERKMGEAFYRRGAHQTARAYLEQALTSLGYPPPTARWPVRRTLVAAGVQQLRHRVMPARWRQRQARPEDPAVQEAAQLYPLLGWIEALVDPERCLLFTLLGLNAAERHGLSYHVARGAAAFGYLCESVGLSGVARRYYQRAKALAEQLHHPVALGLTHLAWMIHWAYRSAWEQTFAHGQRAAASYEAAGDLQGWGAVTAMMAYLNTFRGDFAAALAASREVVRQGRDGADQQVWGWGLVAQATAELRLGQGEAAQRHVQQSAAFLEAVPDPTFSALACGELGQCYLRQGRWAQAVRVLEAHRRTAATHVLRGYAATSLHYGLAEAYIMATEQAAPAARRSWLHQAGAACQAALKHGQRWRPGLPGALRLHGTSLWLRGKPRPAQRAWQRSLALGEAQGQPYDVGLTMLEMGQRHGDRAQVERAVTLFTTLGAQGEVARAQAWLTGARPLAT